MIKKIISALCVLFLTFGFVSCQKSKVDQCLDTQTELIETLQKINDKDSADKYAGDVDKLMDQFFTLFEEINNTPDEETLKEAPGYRNGWDTMGKLCGQIQQKSFYQSEQLRAAFSKKRGK